MAGTSKLWRDTLKVGSFRGVGFQWSRAELEFGRNTATHEFVRAMRNVREDLGPKARDFTVEFFITATTPGAGDYAAKRDRLIAALSQEGTAQLVHPLFGELTVAVLRARVGETAEEGGVARFVVQFGEDGSKEFSLDAPKADTAKTVDAKADQSIAASIRAFASKLSIAGLTKTFTDLAGDSVGGAIGWMKDAIGQGQAIVGAVGQVIGTVQQDAASVIGWVSGANLLGVGGGLGSIGALLNFPNQLGGAIAGQVAGLSFIGALFDGSAFGGDGVTGEVPDAPAVSSAVTVAVPDVVPGTVASVNAIASGADTFPSSGAAAWDPDAALPTVVMSADGQLQPASWQDVRDGAYDAATIAGIRDLQLQVSGYEAPIPFDPANPTPARAQAVANATAVQDLVSQVALVQAAQATVAGSYASADEARTARDDIAERLDQVAATTADPGVFTAFRALRLAVIDDLTTRAMQLPELRAYTTRASVPALALAHRLYDDPAPSDDIVARNGVRHPLFVPGGVTLQVLAHG